MEQDTPQRVIVFAHGWGFDSQFFDPLIQALCSVRPELAHHSLFLKLEQNYFKQRPAEILVSEGQHATMSTSLETLGTLAITHADKPWIGFGHSLGFAHLLHLSLKWTGLCSLHGFTRFMATQLNPSGTPERLLKRMIKQLTVQPSEVLHQFRVRCGVDTDFSVQQINLPRLLNDLEWMTGLDLQEALNIHLQSGTQFQAVYSPTDEIVPLGLTHACFDIAVSKFTGQTRCESVQTPHAGLLTTPQLYTDPLNDWITSFSPC